MKNMLVIILLFVGISAGINIFSHHAHSYNPHLSAPIQFQNRTSLSYYINCSIHIRLEARVKTESDSGTSYEDRSIGLQIREHDTEPYF